MFRSWFVENSSFCVTFGSGVLWAIRVQISPRSALIFVLRSCAFQCICLVYMLLHFLKAAKAQKGRFMCLFLYFLLVLSFLVLASSSTLACPWLSVLKYSGFPLTCSISIKIFYFYFLLLVVSITPPPPPISCFSSSLTVSFILWHCMLLGCNFLIRPQTILKVSLDDEIPLLHNVFSFKTTVLIKDKQEETQFLKKITYICHI